MNKKFRILLELIYKKETPHGAIPISESIKIIKDFGNLAKKLNLDCYVKGNKKDVLDYKPTGKEYEIKTIDDIAEKLNEDQFEMLIEDLRQYCELKRNLKAVNEIFETEIVKSKDEGMIWIDSGLNEQKLNFETTNKIN